MKAKRIIYIFFFIFLGSIVSFIVHAGIEIPVIHFLLRNFEKYGLGLTWEQWYMIHNIGAVVLFAAGTIVGWQQGRYWWRVIYEKRG